MMSPTVESPGQAKGRILYIVEDNAEVGRLLRVTLEQYGFRSEHFTTAAAFLRRLKLQAPALVVIDLGLPDMEGNELVRRVQAMCDSAILILTGRQLVSDRILGLELGADDYMVKPFEPREVVARVNSILRRIERSREPDTAEPRTARFNGWTFEAACNRLTSPSGREVALSVAESRLLTTFLERPNRILSRTELIGDREPFDRSIDARISRLRRKLVDADSGPELIKTVYGAGYMLVAGVDWS